MFIKFIFLSNNDRGVLITKHTNYLFFNVNPLHFLKIKQKLSITILKYFIYTFIHCWYNIRWRGKAFRVKFFKKENKFIFRFGSSHMKKLMYSNVIYKIHRFRRQRFTIHFIYRKNKKNIILNFNYIRFWGKYTRRGIKVKPYPIIRRFGKVSTINQYLHEY